MFAAPAVAWRGVFSVHAWIAVKPTGAPRFTRYEVLGFGVANGASALRIDRMGPDNYWFGAPPQILISLAEEASRVALKSPHTIAGVPSARLSIHCRSCCT